MTDTEVTESLTESRPINGDIRSRHGRDFVKKSLGSVEQLSAKVDLQPTYLYRHFDADGMLLYVGVSLSAVNRLRQHRDHAHWYARIKRVEIEQFPTREEALIAEDKAILCENPLHNLKRPSVKEQEKTSNAEQAKADLTRRLVWFNPIYSMREIADILGIRPIEVKHLIASRELSAIELPSKPGNLPKTGVTGWQLIDYLETLEARAARISFR